MFEGQHFAILAMFFLWFWCYYPHRSRDSVSPSCRIFINSILTKFVILCSVAHEFQTQVFSLFYIDRLGDRVDGRQCSPITSVIYMMAILFCIGPLTLGCQYHSNVVREVTEGMSNTLYSIIIFFHKLKFILFYFVLAH